MAYRDLLNASGQIASQFLPGGSGGVTNPLSENLDCANFDLQNVDAITSSAGALDINVDGGALGGVIIKPVATNGLASMVLNNNEGTYITQYCPSVTGAGLTADTYAIWGYQPGNEDKRILEADASGANIQLGDSSTEGGAVVTIAGTQGLSRVYDATYFIPPSLTLVKEYNYTYGSSTDTEPFVVEKPGVYLIQTIFSSTGATIPASNDSVVASVLSYGDPDHSAEIVPGTSNRATAFMIPDISADYDELRLSCFVQLSNDVYETNQRYLIKTYADAGYADGSLTVQVFSTN